MAVEVMGMAVVTAVVATCMVVTVMAGMVTRIVVTVGQAMPIADLLMATVMVALATVTVIQATVMLTMGMGGGIMVTGILAMVAGGVAAGTLMVLERAGASGQQQAGYGSATSLRGGSTPGFVCGGASLPHQAPIGTRAPGAG